MGINEMIQKEKDNHKLFKQELAILINKYSMENTCDTPDFVLSEMLYSFMVGMGPHIKTNLKWHGCEDKK